MSDKPKNPGKPDVPPPADGDAMDKLPLSMIPLESTTLKAARLVKNSQLETMVELHSGKDSGSLQIRPQDIAQSFPATSPKDLTIIGQLSELRSYDVYSLRNNLARLGIQVDPSQLELSDATRERLEKSSLEFVRPLILSLFGDGAATADKDSLTKLFRDPDIAKVQQRLRLMSQKTGIPVEGIPAFLQGYRDIFLSTTYYRDSFDSIAPDLNRFWTWLAELKVQREVTTSPAANAACNNVANLMRNLFTSTRDRLNKFKGSFESFWKDMNPETFAALRREIEENHDTMGAVLCGIGVKMRNWSKAFPDNNTGSISSRLSYLSTELEPGLDQLMTIENTARERLKLPRLRGQK